MFKLIFTIAWASVARRRARSLLVVLMIAASLWGLLFMEGIYDGMTEQMIDNAVRSDCGHLSLFAAGYRLEPDLKKQIRKTGALRSFLAADSRVRSFTGKLRQNGLAATAHYSRNAEIYGVDLEQEKRHGGLDQYLYQGEYDFGSRGKMAIIGWKFAEKLRVGVGGKIVVSVQDSEGEVAAAALRISGILKTNNLALDEQAVFVPLTRARQLLGLPRSLSQFSVIVHDPAKLTGLQKDLGLAFPGLEVLRWDEMYPALFQSRVIMKWSNLVINLIIFTIAGLGIFGVMLVSVLERLREFGIMLAIGTSFEMIRRIVFAESFLLGFAGFFGGALIGGLTLYYFKIHGLDLSLVSEGLEEFGIDVIIHAVIRPYYFAAAFAAVMPAIFFSVIIPLRILRRAKPIAAINS